MKLLQADVAHESLKPITYTRSVSDIEVGGQTVFEHLQDSLNDFEHHVLPPEYLEDMTEMNSEVYGNQREINPDLQGEYLLYNSSVIPRDGIQDEIDSLDLGEGLFYNDTFVAALVDQDLEYDDLDSYINDFERVELGHEPIMLEYPWNIVEANGELIEENFDGGEINGDLTEDAVIKGSREDLYVGEGSVVGIETEEGVRGEVIIDTTDGPVIIDENSYIGPNTRITGPVYIGSNTKVGAGDNAVIHEKTHIGDVARAGGEIEGVVMHSFSNKYHHGFLGDSVVGSWSNFGAGTTNSDLKNTYGPVRVQLPSEDDRKVAGQFFGTVIADHSKMGIGTNIYTGKLVGPVAQVKGEVEENTGAFTWMNDEKKDYETQKAAEHARRMMERREDHLPEGYIEIQEELIKTLAETE